MKISIFLFFLFFLPQTVMAAEAKKIYVPSNIDPAKELFVIYNASNRTLIKKYVTILKSDKTISLNVFVDDLSVQEAKSFLRNTDGSTSNISLIVTDEEIDSDVGGASDWLQDVGEFFYSKNDKKNKFLAHTDMLNGYEAFTQHLKKKKYPIEVVGKESTAEDEYSKEGGNIEGLPWGGVYIGDTIDKSLLTYFQENLGKKNVVVVPTHFTEVAHVDELYQFVPAAKKMTNGCGYALAYADLLAGLGIAISKRLYDGVQLGRGEPDRTVNSKNYWNSIQYFTGTTVSLEEVKITSKLLNELLKKFDFSKKLRPFKSFEGFRKEDIYVYKAFEAQKKANIGVQNLISAAKVSGCKKLKTISLPEMWTYGFNSGAPPFPETSEEATGFNISNLTAFTNMVVLNQNNLVIPDAKAPSQLVSSFLEDLEWKRISTELKAEVIESFSKIGVTESSIHFADLSGSILGDGAAHCKTSVLRKTDSSK